MWMKPNDVTMETVQYLDETGKLVVEDAGVQDEELLDMYKWMVQARTFDQRALKYQRQGKIGTYAPIQGQEAAQIASAYAMRNEDWVYPSYRELGVCLVRNIPMSDFFLYTMGHVEGNATTRSGNVFPVQIIIGAQCIHAVGGAWASKYQDEKSVSVAYIGDGGTSEGDFHEALNFAGVYELPTIFFVQNNQWAISVPISQQMASKTIAQKAMAYGITGIRVDGNDLLAVHDTMKQALELAREGKPVLIEAVTYRQGAHTTADDPTKYRDQEELQTWLEKDPLARVKAYMISKGIWSEEDDEKAHAEADEKVTEAFETAAATKPSKVGDLFDIVYKNKSSQLAEQQASISAGGVLK